MPASMSRGPGATLASMLSECLWSGFTPPWSRVTPLSHTRYVAFLLSTPPQELEKVPALAPPAGRPIRVGSRLLTSPAATAEVPRPSTVLSSLAFASGLGSRGVTGRSSIPGTPEGEQWSPCEACHQLNPGPSPPCPSADFRASKTPPRDSRMRLAGPPWKSAPARMARSSGPAPSPIDEGFGIDCDEQACPRSDSS